MFDIKIKETLSRSNSQENGGFDSEHLNIWFGPFMFEEWDQLTTESVKYYLEFDDFRYYATVCVNNNINIATEQFLSNVCFLIEHFKAQTKAFLTTVPESHKICNSASQKTLFSSLIVGFVSALALVPDVKLHKRFLAICPDAIIKMHDPKVLMAYLVYCFDNFQGSSVSVLAMHSVFLLVQDHGLDYPRFYEKLYTLMDCNLFHMSCRGKFVSLLEVFLSSSHLPVYLVAAFIKRLCRLSLTAPPGAILLIVPAVYNLLKQNVQCRVLVDRRDEIFLDPYNFDEVDPEKSRAIESSLWEIGALERHYFANIATLAKSLSEKLTKQMYHLDLYSNHNYRTLYKSLCTKIFRPPKLSRK